MAELSVTVETPSLGTEERFIREYVVPTVERFDDADEVRFWGRYSASNTVDGGRVKIVFAGDPDRILPAERDRLDRLDYVEDWHAEVEADDDTRMTGAEQDLQDRLGRVAAEMNVHYFGEFDERPPVGRVTDDRFHTRGIWVLLHFLLNEQGYAPEEEVDALFMAIRDRLARIEDEEDLERVDALVTELQERLDDTVERIETDLVDG